MGIEPAEPVPLSARLTEAYAMQGNRPTYHPARLEWDSTGPTVDANAMMLFPPGERSFVAGDWIDVFPW
jgi:hypothetical protein